MTAEQKLEVRALVKWIYWENTYLKVETIVHALKWEVFLHIEFLTVQNKNMKVRFCPWKDFVSQKMYPLNFKTFASKRKF